MKIGYNEATAMKRSDLNTDLLLTEKYGYDYIEIRLDMLHQYLFSRSISDLANFFANNKVKPYALNAIEEVNFAGECFLRLSEEVKRACAIAEKINNPYLILVPSFRMDIVRRSTEQDIEEDSIEMLNKLADISEQFNVKLAFEPVGFESCAVRGLKQGWDIVRKVNRKSVGIELDVFNLYMYQGLKDLDVLKEIDVKKIFGLHIDDVEGGVPLNKLTLDHRMWPGDGVAPLKKMLNILCRKGYDKVASVEEFRPEYWDMTPEETIKAGKETTEKVIKKYFKK